MTGDRHGPDVTVRAAVDVDELLAVFVRAGFGVEGVGEEPEGLRGLDRGGGIGEGERFLEYWIVDAWYRDTRRHTILLCYSI